MQLDQPHGSIAGGTGSGGLQRQTSFSGAPNPKRLRGEGGAGCPASSALSTGGGSGLSQPSVARRQVYWAGYLKII